jgi:outer membrane protein assembly factor BamB/tetratricopeptide (TPR) repeat protein
LSRRASLFLALGAVLFPGRAAAQLPEDDGARSGRLFAIPDTREARALAVRAGEHLSAGRFREALHDLQRLIEAHRSDVLAPGWSDGEEPGDIAAAYHGAATWAAERLSELPPEGLQLYRDRHREQAELTLARALASGDRRALASVATRWPVADAAERAWWALGDLELERGHVGAATRAYGRAAALRERLRLPAAEGARLRLEAVAALESPGDTAPPQAGAANGSTASIDPLRLPGPGEGGGPVPLGGADSWTAPLPRGPLDGHQRREHHSLFPVRVDDRLLVSNSLELLCLDAHTGQTLWRTGEVAGWSSLGASRRFEKFLGLDEQDVLVAPAAAGGVAVAALQIPWTRLGPSEYQGITITTPIPERRLLAFDLRTGEPLWDHVRDGSLRDWDGDTGSYAETMSVAGPPVIASSRVLVPLYRLEGRIDYHVACFDLATGARLWSTTVLSGQRETNMFGRHEKEFCAPPLRVEGDRVLALTQLGTVAALDLFTGAVQWQGVYEQIPLPGIRGWDSVERRQHWRNAPPVVADGAVVVAPLDSEDLVAFALDDGRRLWTHSQHARSSRDWRERSVLIGADRDTVYIDGSTIVALRRPGGLGAEEPPGGLPLLETWLRSLSISERSADPLGAPRAVLAIDGVLVPTRDSLLVLSREDGLVRTGRALAWQLTDAGNVLAGDGAVITLSGTSVQGFLDWNVLLARARAEREARPGERGPTLELAQLLRRRGENLLDLGETRAARAELRAAEELLQQLVPPDGPILDLTLATLLHGTLRAEARAAARLAETDDALALLARALPLSETASQARDTLLEREELLRTGEAGEWLACLAELEEGFGGLRIPPEHMRFAPEPVLVEHLERAQRTGWDPAESALPVRVWVRLERSFLAGELGRVADELEDLHALLGADGDAELFPGVPAREIAVERIAERLARGDGGAYAVFEARAQEELERAEAERDGAGLDGVARRYPHSVAARRARALRLEWSSASGDVSRVAELVQTMLTPGAGVTEADAQLLLHLAAALGARGNSALEHALYARLAEAWPDLVSDAAAHGGRSVSALLSALDPGADPLPLSERASFGGELRPVQLVRDRFAVLGEAPPVAGRPPRVLLAGSDRIEAWDPSEPDAPSWSYELPFGVTPEYWVDSTRLASGRVVVTAIESVLGVDSETGAEAWNWRPRGDAVQRIEVGEGVVLALSPAGGDRARLQALDVVTGAPLWSAAIDLSGAPRLLIANGRVAVLASRFNRPVRVTVLDLFRGRVLHELELERQLPHDVAEEAWIQDGVLVLPAFLAARDPEQNRVVGIDLVAGRVAWRFELGDREELFAVASAPDGSYLVTHPVSPEETGTGGSISRLDAKTGGVTPLLSLQLGEEVLGLPRSRRTRLGGQYLFLAAHNPGGRTTPVTAVRLPHGEHWVHALPVSYEELYHASLPAPALSTTAVALAYSTVDRRNELERATILLLLDRRTGRELSRHRLDAGLGAADGVSLLGLGPSLFLLGRAPRGPGQLEIWSQKP